MNAALCVLLSGFLDWLRTRTRRTIHPISPAYSRPEHGSLPLVQISSLVLHSRHSNLSTVQKEKMWKQAGCPTVDVTNRNFLRSSRGVRSGSQTESKPGKI
ncbi:hypothetical protein BV20DRAFT_967955 [Pilatotrama ljubarskyi]|nr:hypothetical protein BV20DRAFT_967955 [Pilatotrama ljubarskyi]